jgi:hypothetical protein
MQHVTSHKCFAIEKAGTKDADGMTNADSSALMSA